MYRIILIILLNAALSFACRPPPCHWKAAGREAKQFINYFEAVARKVINTDRKVENFCYKQGCSDIIESHTPNKYTLIIPGAANTNYEIKVRGRVLQIVSESCQNSVTELRVLPSYVNGIGGNYYFDNSDLVVAFPFKYNPGAGGGVCEEPNRNPITLLRGADYSSRGGGSGGPA